jgi:hypothetical protein
MFYVLVDIQMYHLRRSITVDYVGITVQRFRASLFMWELFPSHNTFGAITIDPGTSNIGENENTKTTESGLVTIHIFKCGKTPVDFSPKYKAKEILYILI